MNDRVYVTLPLDLTAEMIRAVRDDPTTSIADREEWHTRLGVGLQQVWR